MPRPTLSVNVNKVALLRNARPGEVPSILHLARLALDAGAHGITVHPRPDERHIRRSDVEQLHDRFTSGEFRGEFNIEGNPLDEGGGHLMAILRQTRPTQATLVPDTPGQTTSDHGFALTQPQVIAELKPLVTELKDLGCRVSLFIDPDPDTVEGAAATGADRVELYTERYAQAFGTVHESLTLERFATTAERAMAAGLGVNAGHDLNLDNLRPFLDAVPSVKEVSIGHALVADALELGMKGAVEAYLQCLT